MATKVKALQSLAGNYGNAAEGDELELRDADATALEAKGAVKIIGKSSGDESAEDWTPSNLTTAKEGQAKGLRITDETNKSGKTGAEGDTDVKNVTGKKPAAKKSTGKK